MTSLPKTPPAKRLGLVIDLDICVGCQACVISCKSWNRDETMPPGDQDLNGAWLNRIYSYETNDGEHGRTVHFPMACLHCENAACVTVCPTGASYKREQDGIVLVDEDKCIGCGLCAWACPYGARDMDKAEGVMKKCTLCIDRIYNETLPAEEQEPACVASCPAKARHFGDFADEASTISQLTAERSGYDLMPELGYRPTNKYLPPRSTTMVNDRIGAPGALQPGTKDGFWGWLDRALSKLP